MQFSVVGLALSVLQAAAVLASPLGDPASVTSADALFKRQCTGMILVCDGGNGSCCYNSNPTCDNCDTL